MMLFVIGNAVVSTQFNNNRPGNVLPVKELVADEVEFLKLK